MRKKKLNKPILAEGELTGHHHSLSAKTEVWEEESGVKEFETNGDTLTHQEHLPIVLSSEIYRSDKRREYDHAKEESRKVPD